MSKLKVTFSRPTLAHSLRCCAAASLVAILFLGSNAAAHAQTAAPDCGPTASPQTKAGEANNGKKTAVCAKKPPLEVIGVTVTRANAVPTNAPGSISVISTQQIRDSAAQELDDVLKTVPGIDLLGYASDTQHPTSDSFGMRGLGGGAQGISRGLVMVDGVPINDPFFGYIQWNRIPLDDIDRVEIIRGGGSPIWGNYAEGGVINVITKSTQQGGLAGDAGYGSYSTYRTSAFAAYPPVGNNLLQIFAEANGTAGYQSVPPYERAPFNVPTSSRAYNVGLKDTLTLSSDLLAHVSLNVHDNRQQLETVLDSNNQQNASVAGDIARQFYHGGLLKLTAFYGDDRFGTNNSTYFPNQTDLAATTDTLNEIHQLRTQDSGGSLIWSQQGSSLLRNYMVGVDVHYIAGGDHTSHFIAPDFSPAYFTTQGGGVQLFTAGFVQATLTPVRNLELVASGRLQYLQDTGGFDGSLGGLGAVPDHEYNSLNPRVDVRYGLPAGFALRGSYYTSFRAPNLGDEFYTYAAGGFVQLPSPLLQPEHLQGSEVGVDYTRSGLRAQLTAYRSWIDNYIVIEPSSNAVYSPPNWFVVQNQNIAAVRAQGIETEIDWNISSRWSTQLAYTLADSVVQQNPLDPASVGEQIIDVPRTKVSSRFTYTAPTGWRAALQMTYVSATDWASPDHTDPGYPGAISADPHLLVNLSGSYPVSKNLEVYTHIENLFDRRYLATSYSAPSAEAYGMPREIFAGIRYR